MAFQEIPGCLQNEPPITSEDQARILVLDTSESSSLWDKWISSSNRHFMLLDSTEWPIRIVTQTSLFLEWHDDWNADASENIFQKLLALDFGVEDDVYVFWMRETAAKTCWLVFARNWMNFLFEDEGVIVVIPNKETSLIFSNGKSWVGDRANQ